MPRYYSPTLGRFINRDPIAEQGGLNLYGFCTNNGVNKWDYLGMDDKKWNKMSFNQALRDGGYRDANGNWNVVKSTGKLGFLNVVLGVVASVLTYGAASGFVTTSLAGSATSIGATWSATTVSIVSGTVAGAASGVVGQVASTGSFDNLGEAALSGAILGGVTGGFGDTWNATRVATTAVAGGTVAEINGGDFADGALIAGGLAAARLGWEHIEDAVDASSLTSTYANQPPQFDSNGRLLTDGGRPTVLAPGVADYKGNFITQGGMAAEASGQHMYDPGRWVERTFGAPVANSVRTSVNLISKIHDWQNSWNYDRLGNYIRRGVGFDTAFQTYSFAGMPVAAAATGGIFIGNNPWVQQQLLDDPEDSEP